GLRLPGVGPQVIATQHDPFTRQAGLVGHAQNEIAKLRRPEARVTAVLIDLVGSRLDERQPLFGLGMLEGSANDDGMRRAYRVDSDGCAGTVTLHDRGQVCHERPPSAGSIGAGSSGSMASSAAAAKASTTPTIFSVCGTTPSSASEISAVIKGAPA